MIVDKNTLPEDLKGLSEKDLKNIKHPIKFQKPLEVAKNKIVMKAGV